MLKILAINHYRSLFDLVIPLKKLNIITGVNASGKSNLYKALRLLAETAEGGVIHSLAKEGGLNTTFWAGPEKISRQMIKGEVAIQGNSKQNVARLRLGFADDLFGYSISLGYPEPSLSAFSLDPEIKRETIWAGDVYKASSVLVDRTGPLVKVRDGRKWEVIEQYIPVFESIFTQAVYIDKTPEIIRLREKVKGWRFYDHFRSDKDAPARLPQLGTRTPVLSQDGHDLAAALQTIIEIGDSQALVETIEDAFPGTKLGIKMYENGHFIVELYQQGLLRPLSASELSDGTLRYLLWVAALLTPRPPELMVLNEPETSLHPDLLPALARLIIKAAKKTQIWVVSHANRLVSALRESEESNLIELDKEFGQTKVLGQGLLDKPNWYWPDIK
ncbi:ATP-binding protein [Francisella tularensis subsp. novicida]|uniref:AAA family ATPase n=1 Tax=Francisella tularensis TaxID=263 RepID=UPI000CE29CE2|nr:AAA family ATPase [Francisella tularensis]AVC44099.1 ATP-binding protein [Francisella tularensis subsp. novicida]